MEKTGCKIICGAPTTLAVKGLMMMMMNEPTTGPSFSPFKPDIFFATFEQKCI